MSKRKGLIVAATVVVVLLIAGIAYWSSRKRLARLTAEATNANVLSVTVERRRRRLRTSTDTRITYQYEVGGRSIQGSTDKSGDQAHAFKTGAPAKVCYNPSKPEESEIFMPDHVCGS